MYRFIFIIVLLLLSHIIFGQNATISGYLTDASSGESLLGGAIRDVTLNRGTSSNQYGFFSLTLPVGDISISASYLGYNPLLLNFYLKKDTSIAIRLTPLSKVLDEVVIIPENTAITRPPGLINIPVERLKQVPAIFGESDIIKALSLTPGVSIGTEGSTGLYIRGGSPDQNLILLDEAVVYNASHLFGFVSILNPDAVKNVDLYKAGFPARFGGRLSSVLDITMKEGNNQELKGEASIGIISSRFSIEGPISKNKSSFILSARSSYLSLFLLPSFISFKQGRSDNFVNYWLYDLNGKVNHQFKDGSRLFLSFYNGNDFLVAYDGIETENSKFRLNWGNFTTSARYVKPLNPKLFSRSVFTYSRYRYMMEGSNSQDKVVTDFFNTESRVNDYTIKTALDFLPSPNHSIKVGLEAIRHQFLPSNYNSSYSLNIDSLNKANTIYAVEGAAFIEDEVVLNERIKVNTGARWSVFNVEGTTYNSLEPRVSINFKLPALFSLQGSYSTMRQYIHLLTSSGVGFPNDIWVPATREVKPQFSRQVALGLTKSLPGINSEFTVEGYYKTMTGLIDYRQGSNFLISSFNQNWQDEIVREGVGEAYGLEFFLNRKSGPFTGWIAYTLAWNNRRFDNINFGNWHPGRYDRRHDVSFTGSYDVSKAWNLFATWVFSTGHPVTVPSGIQEDIEGNKVFIYSGRNNARMPKYHRLDVGAAYSKTTKRGRSATWSFGAYNAYNRANPFFLDFRNNKSEGDIVKKQLVSRSLFPVLPYISYTLSF
ncbi:MAG: TonB-dependent receptor [Bacteroidota bacterium]|nr:TonB-dependent receptor [Bacteroidota bacterium]